MHRTFRADCPDSLYRLLSGFSFANFIQFFDLLFSEVMSTIFAKTAAGAVLLVHQDHLGRVGMRMHGPTKVQVTPVATRHFTMVEVPEVTRC